MAIRVTHQAVGSNITNNPLEIKKVQVYSEPSRFEQEGREQDVRESDSEQTQEPVSPEERRSQRKEEFREAASIRERALKMQRDAEEQGKQYKQFSELMQQAKEDPTILAKALNMDPSEFQRKIFNKSFSIKDDPVPVKEETFEEKTQRRLEQYESQLAEERERRNQELRQNNELQIQKVKRDYIQENIYPSINESHEFIMRNDKESCASLVYDLMNNAYQEHLQKGGQPESFTLRAEDVVNQMEEELEKRAEEELEKIRGIGKLKKYFREDSSYRGEDGGLQRKDFSSRRQASPTLSNSYGPSAPTSLGSSNGMSSRKIPLSNKQERLKRLRSNLGE